MKRLDSCFKSKPNFICGGVSALTYGFAFLNEQSCPFTNRILVGYIEKIVTQKMNKYRKLEGLRV